MTGAGRATYPPVHLPRGSGKGRYSLTLLGNIKRRSITVYCPTCSLPFKLPDHQFTVEVSGYVQPSVICPGPGCTFSSYVVLDGWRETL